FCALLADAGTEVLLAESDTGGNPDAIYTYDPALVTDEGALLLHPGKRIRRGEVGAIAEDFERAGVPIARRLAGPPRARESGAVRSARSPRTSSAPECRSPAGWRIPPGPRAGTAAGWTSGRCS